MARKRHGAEQIVPKPREAEVELVRGATAQEACRKGYRVGFTTAAGPGAHGLPSLPTQRSPGSYRCQNAAAQPPATGVHRGSWPSPPFAGWRSERSNGRERKPYL